MLRWQSLLKLPAFSEQAKSALEEMLNNDVYLHHNHAEPVAVVSSQKSVYSVYRSHLTAHMKPHD